VIYQCCDENRKAAVLGHPTLNGIDYLEVIDEVPVVGMPPDGYASARVLKALRGN